MLEKIKVGFIPAHRNLMDEDFALEARNFFYKKFASNSLIDLYCPEINLTKNGLVRNYEDSQKVIQLFSSVQLDCLIIGNVTFGDETSVLNIIERFSHLPIFLFAVAEPVIPKNEFFKSASVCGLLPISFGLKRRNIKFTFGGIAKFKNSNKFKDKEFDKKLDLFLKNVFALKSFKNARIGMIGSRPNEFEVCAVNEAMMIRKFNQKIIHFNLIDLKNDIEKSKKNNKEVDVIINEIINNTKCYYKKEELINLAAFELQLLKYIEQFNLNTLTIQCWTSIQRNIGITPCLTSSRLNSIGYPVGCEGDVNNALMMLIQRKMTLSKKFPMILDILTMHPEKDDYFLLWHCGNVSLENRAKGQEAKVLPQCPWEKEFGRVSSAASIEFLIKSGIVTVNSLVEHEGCYKLLNFTAEMIESNDDFRGAWSWIKVKERDSLYDTIVNEGFTHHVSVIHEDLTEINKEFCKYLDIDFVNH